MFASQSDVITRQVDTKGLSYDQADFEVEDAGRNADLYYIYIYIYMYVYNIYVVI